MVGGFFGNGEVGREASLACGSFRALPLGLLSKVEGLRGSRGFECGRLACRRWCLLRGGVAGPGSQRAARR